MKKFIMVIVLLCSLTFLVSLISSPKQEETSVEKPGTETKAELIEPDGVGFSEVVIYV